MDVGPKRDILGDLAVQIKQQTSPQTGRRLKFGVYHSMYEWYNPLYTADRAANFTTQHFVDTKTVAELYDLVQQYKPELIWSDGDWEAHSDYWKSREFLHWYATESPVAETAVWNDRWGFDTNCRHGGFVTCTDRYNPDTLQPRKYEDAFTIDTTSWGWNRNSSLTNYLSVKEIVHTLIQVVAFNGNVLLNVGPGSDGTISPIFLDRLRGIGKDQVHWFFCVDRTELTRLFQCFHIVLNWLQATGFKSIARQSMIPGLGKFVKTKPKAQSFTPKKTKDCMRILLYGQLTIL